MGAELSRASLGSTAPAWFLLQFWSCSAAEALLRWAAGWQRSCGGNSRSLPGSQWAPGPAHLALSSPRTEPLYLLSVCPVLIM